MFKDTSIKITTQGRRHLGACVRDTDFKTSYLTSKVDVWVQVIKRLSVIARSEPHCALAAFTHGLRNRYVYVMRTIPEIETHLQPLEDSIRNYLLPPLLEVHICNDDERKLIALSPKFGGLGVINPTEICREEYKNSRGMTHGIVSAIKGQREVYVEDTTKLNALKNKIKTNKVTKPKGIFEDIKTRASDPRYVKILESSIEQGAYNWLTALPLVNYGYHLDKRTFWDSVRIRYNLPSLRLPEKCVCFNNFDILTILYQIDITQSVISLLMF